MSKTNYEIRYGTSPGTSATYTARSKAQLAHFIAYICESRGGSANFTVKVQEVPRATKTPHLTKNQVDTQSRRD